MSTPEWNEETRRRLDTECAKEPMWFSVQRKDVIQALAHIDRLTAEVERLKRGIDAGEEVVTLSAHGEEIARREAAEAKLAEAQAIADHQIPVYAYGDNEAACEMAGRLAKIRGL